MKRVLLLAVLAFAGCKSGGDVWLKGDLGTRFRALTHHEAITLADNIALYATERPPSAQIICHENRHKAQFAVIADALIAIGAIDDDPPSRMAAALAVYTIEHLQVGYEGNRFEREALAACPNCDATDTCGTPGAAPRVSPPPASGAGPGGATRP